MFGAGLAAGAVLDPDMMSWVPGRRVTSIPKPFETLSLFEDFEFPAHEVFATPGAIDPYVAAAAKTLRTKLDSFGYKHGVFVAPRDPRKRGICGKDTWKRHGIIPHVGGLGNVRLLTIQDLPADLHDPSATVSSTYFVNPPPAMAGFGRLDIILAPRG